MAEDRIEVRFGRSGSARHAIPGPGGQAVAQALEFLPNLDADGRRLPPRVEEQAEPVVLDHVATTKSGRDNDLVALTIRPGSAGQVARPLVLSVRGDLARRINVYDAKGNRLTPSAVADRTVDYGVILSGKDVALRLESSTLAGSPLSEHSGRRIEIDLIDLAGGTRAVKDTVALAVAQVRLADCLDPPELVYICQTDGNKPARSDLRAGLPGNVGLRVVPESVSGGDTWLQDQMEFGFLEAQGQKMRIVLHLPRLRSDAAQVTATQEPNLARLVRSHFPSQDFGIFDELWQRKVTVTLASGASRTLDFEDTGEIQTSMGAVNQLYRVLLGVMARLRDLKAPTMQKIARARMGWEFAGWSEGLLSLPALVDLLVTATAEDDAAGADPYRDMSADEVKAANADVVREAKARLAALVRSKESPKGIFAFDANTVTIPVGKASSIRLTSAGADDLDDKIATMLRGVNHGGNIEPTPPDRTGRNGRILIGSRSDVDADVRRFLSHQELQPGVVIDTSWLAVGHVDEVVASVPDSRRAGGFAFLRASPGLAIRMVNEAARRHIDGLPPTTVQSIELREFGRAPRKGITRPTSEGKHPVTRLLRGRLWHHLYKEGAPDSILPPLIYRDFARIDTQFRLPGKERTPASAIGRYFVQGTWSEERLYPADISVHELGYLDRLPPRELLKSSASHASSLEAGRVPRELRAAVVKAGGLIEGDDKVTPSARTLDTWLVAGPWATYRMSLTEGRLLVEESPSVNAWLEAHHIAKAVKVLASAFPESRILPLPVLFDTVGDVRDWKEASRNLTGAYTPNLVNLQSVGRTLLVPRPFGPRLSPADALALVRDLLDEFGLGPARKYLNSQYLKDQRMVGIRFWLRPQPAIHLPGTRLDTERIFIRGTPVTAGPQLFPGIGTVRDVAEMFSDGFPGRKIDEIEELILDANDRQASNSPFVDRRLKKGWHLLTIPENTVDVFELWTHLAASQLGLRVRWVDAWYYHVRAGGIHCGTKVLRRSARSLVTQP